MALDESSDYKDGTIFNNHRRAKKAVSELWDQ